MRRLPPPCTFRAGWHLIPQCSSGRASNYPCPHRHWTALSGGIAACRYTLRISSHLPVSAPNSALMVAPTGRRRTQPANTNVDTLLSLPLLQLGIHEHPTRLIQASGSLLPDDTYITSLPRVPFPTKAAASPIRLSRPAQIDRSR